MNRRQLLKSVLALPVMAAVPAALGARRFEHVWRPDASICQCCGVSELDIEEGLATKFCRVR